MALPWAMKILPIRGVSNQISSGGLVTRQAKRIHGAHRGHVAQPYEILVVQSYVLQHGITNPRNTWNSIQSTAG